MGKPLIFELPSSAAPMRCFPEPPDEAAEAIPPAHRRTVPLPIPALDEPTLQEHFAEMASPGARNWPGAACVARGLSIPGLTRLHPRQSAATAQGALEIAHEVARALAAATGLDRFSLQPPTLAAARRAALQVAKASFARTQPDRNEVVGLSGSAALGAAEELGLVARSIPRLPNEGASGCHAQVPTWACPGSTLKQELERGTPPVPVGVCGDWDLDALVGAVGPRTVAIVASWLRPSGAFERSLPSLAEVAHAHGALLCVDATGLGALLGRTRLREAGADVAWVSLSELCPSARSAALGVRAPLTEFLPVPLVGKGREGYELDDELTGSIGPLALGPFHLPDALAVYVRLLGLGAEGLRG